MCKYVLIHDCYRVLVLQSKGWTILYDPKETVSLFGGKRNLWEKITIISLHFLFFCNPGHNLTKKQSNSYICLIKIFISLKVILNSTTGPAHTPLCPCSSTSRLPSTYFYPQNGPFYTENYRQTWFWWSPLTLRTLYV